jgi:hypothetical protein
MADFTPKKVSSEKGKATGSLPHDSAEHQDPPRVYLEHHHLEKLGLKKMPAVGSKIKVSGVAHVGSTSENTEHAPSGGKAPGKEGSTRRTMTLHFHKMELGREGISDGEKEESQKAGMKGAMDKALKRAAGGDGVDSEGEE